MKLSAILLLLGTSASLALSSAPASAAVAFVGSWDVYDPGAPVWFGSPPNGPLAYTGQEAAALLFGGTASKYKISTAGNLVANINNKAWYDTIGAGGSIQAENFNVKYLGQYYGPTSGYGGGIGVAAASAYIRDNLSGRGAINYAFADTAVSPTPEPEAWASMALGLGLAGWVARRRKAKLAAAA
jgi:hypothetical protein